MIDLWNGCGLGRFRRSGRHDERIQTAAEPTLHLAPRRRFRAGGLFKKRIWFFWSAHGYIPGWSRAVVSGKPNMTFMFCMAWPAWPFIRLSIIETMRNLPVR